MRHPFGLRGAVGPGFENDPEDMAYLGRLIEAHSGVSPFANLPDDGTATADSLTPGYKGAIQTAQIVTGQDPDGIVIPDGPTLRALNDDKEWPISPRIKATIGRRGPNRPEDQAVGQSMLARIGYAPPVVDPRAPGRRRVDADATLRGLVAYQRANGLKADGTMTPDGETARAIERQIDRQRKALIAAMAQTTEKIIRGARAGDPATRGIGDLAAARALAGNIAGEAVARQKADKLNAVAKDMERWQNISGTRGGADRANDEAVAGAMILAPRPIILPRVLIRPSRPFPPRIPIPETEEPTPADPPAKRKEDPHGGPLTKPDPFEARRNDKEKKDARGKRGVSKTGKSDKHKRRSPERDRAREEEIEKLEKELQGAKRSQASRKDKRALKKKTEHEKRKLQDRGEEHHRKDRHRN